MPYDPYASGWQRPSWWVWPTEGWHPYGEQGTYPTYMEANAIKFLNAILPMMRTETDRLELGRAIATMAGQHQPFAGYAGKTTAAGPLFTGGPQHFQSALGTMTQVQHGTGRYTGMPELKNWLQGLWGLGGQYGMTPTGPRATGATREQRRGFRQAFGQALERGPAGAEMYAPWMQRLFMPSVSRPMPGQYQFDPQTQRWQVQRQPRFY